MAPIDEGFSARRAGFSASVGFEPLPAASGFSASLRASASDACFAQMSASLRSAASSAPLAAVTFASSFASAAVASAEVAFVRAPS